MQEKIRKTAFTWIPYIVSMVLDLSMFAAGLLVQKHTPILHARLLCLLFAGVTVFCAVGSFVGKLLYERRFDNMHADEQVAFILSNKEKLQQEYDRAEKNLLRLKHIVIFYMICIVLLTLAVSFFYGAADFQGGGWIALILFSAYIQADLVYVLMSLAEKPDLSQYEKEADFPQIYALAHRAAETAGVDGEVRIFWSDECNAGIQRVGKKYVLELGVLLLAVLNEDELLQVLLHEFAHMKDERLQVNRSAAVLSAVLECSGSSTHGLANLLLFSLPQAVFNVQYLLFHTAASELYETHADAQAKQYGDARTAVSGLAKIAMYELFSHESCFLYPSLVYENPNPPTDLCTTECMQFRDAVTKRKDFWLQLLHQELPPRLSSHPTFRQRYEALGSPVFSIELPELHTPYFDEVLRAAAVMDKYYTVDEDQYAETREEEYLKPLETVRAFEKEQSQRTPAELRPVLEAYVALHRFDDAESLCRKILQTAKSDKEGADAAFTLGYILLLRYDSDGEQYLKSAMQVSFLYRETGLELLGWYYAITGKEQELLEYRKQVDAFLNDEQKLSELKASDTLSLVPQTEALKAQIAHIVSLGADVIEKIYLVKKEINETEYTYAYILRFSKDADTETREKIIDDAIDGLSEDDALYAMFEYDWSYDKILKAVGNCCVYEKP